MKPFFTVTTFLLSLFVFVGCSTVDLPPDLSSAELKRQREAATDKAVYEESMRKTYESAYTSQKSEVERLRAENEALKKTQTKNAADEQACKQWVEYLRINDYLLEHHDEVVKHFNAQYSDKREALFSAAGAKGKLLGFEVDDVFFYRGYVVISSVLLWENPDGAGGLGRCAVSLDPDKNLDAVGCEMTGQKSMSRQELASLLQGGNAAEPSSAQLGQAGAQISAPPASATKPFFSDATKDKLIGAGITLGSAWLLRVINSSH